MQPVLFRLPEFLPLVGGAPINSFGVLLYLAFVAGGIVLHREFSRKGYEGAKAWDIVFWTLIAGLVGAKLYWVAAHPDLLRADPAGTLFSGEGLTWYGGFALGLLVFWLSVRRAGIPEAPALDALGLALPLSISVGRIGCFLAGDDYGRPTDFALGVAFPDGHPPTRVDVLESRFGVVVDPALIERFGEVVPVHPTQLYEAALSLIVFGVVYLFRKHPHRAGWLFAFWLTLYGGQRFVIEILRVNPRVFLGLTEAQILSLLASALGAYFLFRTSRKGEGRKERVAAAG